MTCAFDHSRNKANQDLGTVVLRRKSACSQRADDEECDECKKRSLRGSVHKKLLVGAVDDPLELEADRIADAFLRHTPTTAGDSPAGGKTKAPFSAAYPDGNAQSEIAEAGRGERLPRDLAAEFQSFSGRDFSDVVIHTDAAAARSAASFSARAYTLGSHIVFGNRQFQPRTRDGKWLLAHELAHVVQQHSASTSSGTADSSVLRRKLIEEPAGGCGVCNDNHLTTGRIAHELIQTEMQIQFPLSLTEFPVSAPGDENGRLDLAIATPTGFEVGEIKPASAKGYLRGAADIAFYTTALQSMFPDAVVKPMTRTVPGTVFPNPKAGPGCPIQALAVNPPVGGVYGYYCEPPVSVIRSQSPNCKCGEPENSPDVIRVPSLETISEILRIMGISFVTAAVVVAALADPEPASKLALAGLSLVMIERLMAELDKQAAKEA
jgi:hypothetical protein